MRGDSQWGGSGGLQADREDALKSGKSARNEWVNA